MPQSLEARHVERIIPRLLDFGFEEALLANQYEPTPEQGEKQCLSRVALCKLAYRTYLWFGGGRDFVACSSFNSLLCKRNEKHLSEIVNLTARKSP